jgi:hypothetical protein
MRTSTSSRKFLVEWPGSCSPCVSPQRGRNNLAHGGSRRPGNPSLTPIPSPAPAGEGCRRRGEGLRPRANTPWANMCWPYGPESPGAEPQEYTNEVSGRCASREFRVSSFEFRASSFQFPVSVAGPARTSDTTSQNPAHGATAAGGIHRSRPPEFVQEWSFHPAK